MIGIDFQWLHVVPDPVGLLFLPRFHIVDMVLFEQARLVVDNASFRRQIDLEWLVSHLDDPLIRAHEGDGEVVALLSFGYFAILIGAIPLVLGLV